MPILMLLISVLIISILLCILPHLVWLIWLLVAAIAHLPMPHYAPFGYTALALVVVAWLVIGYGYFLGRFKLQIFPTEYANAAIPASFGGYKIVQISDLHLSTFDDRPAELQRFVDSINAQKPDLICFTGDLVTMGVSEAEPYADILRQLRATDGVVSVLGNHDFMIYAQLDEEKRLEEVEKLANFERETLGWQLLRNQHIEISRNGEKMNIVGVDNSSCSNEGFRTIHNGDLHRATEGIRAGEFSILLSHDPTHWRAEVVGQTAIPLTLSGHTHAGQVRLFGWSLSSVSFAESHGWYTANGQSLYVNEGLGCTAPFRIACPAEITVFTLRKR
jgi:uncharacterized protein